MDKPKTYYLKDEEKIVAKFVFDDVDYFEGACYECVNWFCDEQYTPSRWLFHSSVYAKWDGCTHWNFYGEDFDEGLNESSYYHLCGHCNFENHIRLMCFVWKLAMDYHLKDTKKDIHSTEYTKQEYKTNLIDVMLDGYSIIEE